ncbi:MAG: hypothetical protein LPK03_08455, partial [Pontibacter sp.]|nr:hypothetical protein [Pontibacter sp.]
EAQNLLQTIKQLVSQSGLREYYHPFTGEGNGAKDFTWSGLVVDMIKRAAKVDKNQEAAH